MDKTRISETTRGVYSIAPPPFEAQGAVDHASIDSLVDFYRDKGVDGITSRARLSPGGRERRKR